MVIVIAPVSGGKDSQGALLWAKEKYGNVLPVFCDVKWEALETYKHIAYLIDKAGVDLKVLSSEKYDGMMDLAIKKKRFPSTKARFCTVELKVVPMVDFILSLESHIIFVDGIRADESERRSKMLPECRYFKYYFEPYRTNEMIVEELSLKEKLTASQKRDLKKAKDRLELGFNDEKFFTYRKEDVFEWCKKYDDSLVRPFFYATAEEVISFSLERGYEINPRYMRGYSRVGCDPCVMEGIEEIEVSYDEDPTYLDRLHEKEIEAGTSFFPPDKIPKRYHSKTDKNGKTYPTALDVKRYIIDRKATKRSRGRMFDDDPIFKCKSVYNICE